MLVFCLRRREECIAELFSQIWSCLGRNYRFEIDSIWVKCLDFVGLASHLVSNCDKIYLRGDGYNLSPFLVLLVPHLIGRLRL
ncbi:unnamed protein product [Tenebrio molitor]|nr:unnamed protein product [Tenebrio molitor]